MSRDPRWERVWARSGTPEYDIVEPMPDEWYKDMLEIRIEVRDAGMFYWQVQRIHKEDLKGLPPDAYQWLLDKMVEVIDERMEGHRDQEHSRQQ